MTREFYKRRNFPLASVIFSFALFFKFCGTKEKLKSRSRKVSSPLSFFDFIRAGFWNKGFTLIELLIAVAITSILLTALYAAFFSIHRVTEAVEDKLERRLDTGHFLDQFVREVNSVYFKDTNSRTIFKGEKKGPTSILSFTCFTRPALKEGSPASDLMAVGYFVEEENGEGILYRETRNPYGEDKSKPVPAGSKRGIEVLKGIKGFEVGFFNGKDWASAWDASLEKRLPDAVRAAVITDEGKELSAIAVPRIR